MTTPYSSTPDDPSATAHLAKPFPRVGPRMRNALRELQIAEFGTKEQRVLLGDLSALPRPWDPPSCHSPELRAELWAWLEDVITWLNHEYVWDVGTLIPPCWPRHPHVVHEISTLADQRRRAGEALTSDPLEDWHRYCLPPFQDRLRARLRDHCGEGHQTWPARGRDARHRGAEEVALRRSVLARDLQAGSTASAPGRASAQLTLVDRDTGELIEDED